MLNSLKFSNFYSFVDEVALSFEVGKKPAASSFDINLSSGKRLNKTIAVIGANGSGKTQFIKPMAFLSWFITGSFLSDPEAEIPYKPHALFQDKPSNFEVTFFISEDEYRYKLILEQGKVKHESLHRRTSHLFSYIFVRELDSNDDVNYDYKQQGFGFSAAKARQIRSNASLLSAAYNYYVEAASDFVKYFEHYIYNLNLAGRQHFQPGAVIDGAEYFNENVNMHRKMEELLCSFDLGVCSVVIDEAEAVDAKGKKSKVFIPMAVHQGAEQEFRLPLFEESSGTQSAFVLLRRILPVLENGGVAVIDEIDNDLHPHMLPHILELFKFEHTNPHQAQLIFTCHTPEVLNLLKKHQVYLVEKNDQRSDAWRLDEVIGLRADDNLYAKYMAGALSAVPDL